MPQISIHPFDQSLLGTSALLEGKGPWPSHNTMYAKTERALWRMARPCSVVAKPADTKGCPDSNQSNSKRSSWQWTTILDRHSKFLYMDKWEKFTSCGANGLVLSNPIVLNISIITMQLLLRGYRRTDSHLWNQIKAKRVFVFRLMRLTNKIVVTLLLVRRTFGVLSSTSIPQKWR